MNFKEAEGVLPRNQAKEIKDLLGNFTSLIEEAINFVTLDISSN